MKKKLRSLESIIEKSDISDNQEIEIVDSIIFRSYMKSSSYRDYKKMLLIKETKKYIMESSIYNNIKEQYVDDFYKEEDGRLIVQIILPKEANKDVKES